MHIIKFLHLVCVFIWIGNLLSLTRLLGYGAKETPEVQLQMAKTYKRMYSYISLPFMFLTFLLGMILLTALDTSYKPGWFHMKLTCVMGLFVCDIICGKWIGQRTEKADSGRGIKYKILHGVTGLLLIGVLASSTLIRDKTGEILHKHKMMEEAAKKAPPKR